MKKASRAGKQPASAKTIKAIAAKLKSRGAQTFKEWEAENTAETVVPDFEHLRRFALAGEKPTNEVDAQMSGLVKEYKRLSFIVRWASLQTTPGGRLAMVELVEQAYKNTLHLYAAPAPLVIPTSATMTCFPLLIAARPSHRMDVNAALTRLEVGRDRINHHASSKTKNDYYSFAVEQIADTLLLRHSVKGDDNKALLKLAAPYIEKFLDDEKTFRVLATQVQTRSNIGKPGRIRAAVKDKLKERLESLFGFNKAK